MTLPALLVCAVQQSINISRLQAHSSKPAVPRAAGLLLLLLWARTGTERQTDRQTDTVPLNPSTLPRVLRRQYQ